MMSTVRGDQCAFAFDRSIPPVLEIDPGMCVRFETSDEVYERIAAGESPHVIGAERLNAVSGPVFVRGAQPGDALRIEVRAIEVIRAWSVWVPGLGLLGEMTSDVHVEQMPMEGQRIRIAERVTVPLAPMIGCIGLAPAAGAASTMAPLYRGGGNMDLRELSPGAVISIPVDVPGGLLSLGDLHAAMGQGEPTGVSIEAAGAAIVRIDVEHDSALRSPRLRVGNQTICIGLGTSHAHAQHDAALQAYELLTGEFGLLPFAAYAYASAALELRFAGPSGSMVNGQQRAALAVVPDPTD
jgi:amidase